MCTPQVAIAVVQGVMQQNAAVDAANRQNALYRQNAANAMVAATDEQRALNRRIGQEGDAAAQKSFDLILDSIRRTGTAQTAAGEAGVAGNSVSRLLNDITRQTTVAQNTVSRNFDMTKAQLEDSKESTKTTFNSRVNSVQKGYAPSASDALLGIGLSAGAAYAGSGNNAKTWGDIDKDLTTLKGRGSNALPPKAS